MAGGYSYTKRHCRRRPLNSFCMEIDIKKLYYKVVQLEEALDLVKEKKWHKDQLREHKRVINLEYSNLLKDLEERIRLFSPERQMNVRKLLLSNLPQKPMSMDKYLRYLEEFTNKKHLKGFSLGEYEILLRKLGVVNCYDEVDRSLVSEDVWALILAVL